MGAATTSMTEHDSEEAVIDDTADITHDKEAVTSATTDEQALSLIKYLETNSTQVGPLKIKIEESLHNVLNMVCKCNEPSILETVKKHIYSAMSVMEASHSESNTNFSPVIKVAPNTSNKKQGFFSTKKDPASKRRKIAKPTEREKDAIESQMSTTTIKVCSQCWDEDDTCNISIVEWVACESCGIWTHMKCAGNYVYDSTNSVYYCNICYDKKKNE